MRFKSGFPHENLADSLMVRPTPCVGLSGGKADGQLQFLPCIDRQCFAVGQCARLQDAVDLKER